MRAHHGTLAALNARLGIPYRYVEREVTFFPLCRTGWKTTITWKSAHGNLVAVAGVYGAEHLALKLGGLRRERRRHFDLAADFCWNIDFVQVGQGFVHSFQIFLDYIFALPPVGVTDGLADLLNRFFPWKNFGDGKETGLQDRVHARPHAGITRYLVGVDHVELGLLLDQMFLYFARQFLPDLIRAKGAVQQKYAAFNKRAEHVVAFQEYPLMTGHKICL